VLTAAKTALRSQSLCCLTHLIPVIGAAVVQLNGASVSGSFHQARACCARYMLAPARQPAHHHIMPVSSSGQMLHRLVLPCRLDESCSRSNSSGGFAWVDKQGWSDKAFVYRQGARCCSAPGSLVGSTPARSVQLGILAGQPCIRVIIGT
jgi:hypothetical protein